MTSTGVPEPREDQMSPARLAHFVLKTPRYEEMVAWWMNFLDARPVFEGSIATFMTYDGEHHRVGIVNMPHLYDADPLAAGFAHVAFGYNDVADLVANYERMGRGGYRPSRCVNHGSTTSIYFRDPDDNEVEMMLDNFPDLKSLNEWFSTGVFDTNPAGVEFDPDVLAAKFHEGAPNSELVLMGWPKQLEPA